MTVPMKQRVDRLVDRVMVLEKRLSEMATEAVVLKTRVECYERMLDAVFRGLAMPAYAPPHPFQAPFTLPPVVSRTPTAGGGT